LLNRILIFLLLLLPAAAAAGDSPLRLATTTTTVNSGLMDYLLPEFTAATGIEVRMIAAGTGEALRLGRNGDVDVLLVHARDAEDEFVEAGYGVDRADVMYNDFVIVGPPADPAGIGSAGSPGEALGRIADGEQPFVSRGDDSGTHRRELKLWRQAGRSPGGSWYREVGQGMGRTLQIADQMNAYTLTDRGTWLAYRGNLQIRMLFEGNPPLLNPYGIIAVNPARYPEVNYQGARRLIEWITSPAARRLIDDYRVDGKRLFIPAGDPLS
jgi:tungstate transport system substrate-binding protein